MPIEKDFKNYLELKGLGSLSIKTYLYYYNKFGGIQNFDKDSITSFILGHNNHPPVRAFIGNLRMFLLNNPELIVSINKTVDTIEKLGLPQIKGTIKKRIPITMSEAEVRLIEEGFKEERNKLMILFNFYCGLRVDELVHVGIYDFQTDWMTLKDRLQQGKVDTIQLRIIGKGNKERRIFVNKEIITRTYNYLIDNPLKGEEKDNTPIFNIGVRRWEVLLHNKSQKVLGKAIHPHILRHSCASWLHNQHGWDLKEIARYLGHDSVSTTEIYTHINDKQLESKFNDLFKAQ